MKRIAIVSSIRPETNYSTYLISALQKRFSDQLEILVYTDTDIRNLEVPISNVNLVWDRNWKYLFQVVKKAVSDKVDIIHLQHEINMYGGAKTAVMFPVLIMVLRLFRFNPVVTIHAAIPVSMIDKRMLEVFNWPYPRILTFFVRVIFPAVYFLIGLFSKKVIVHTSTIRLCLIKDYKISGSKIVVIPHGVPEVVEGGFSEPNQPWVTKIGDRRTILYFGYLHKRKGIEYLIKAFKSIASTYKDYVLVISGGAIQENYFKFLVDLSKELKMEDRIIFTEFVDIRELNYLMDKCEFVVLPAIYSIAASGPLAQVFAHEKPVIVTKIGSYAEEITDGVNGLMVKPEDLASLARAIKQLITDVSLKQKLTIEISKIHRQRSWSNIAAKTLEVYSSL